GAFGQIADTMHVEDEAIRARCHLDQLPDDEFRAIECYLALQAVTLDPGRDLPQPNRQLRRADSSRRKIERREHAAQDQRGRNGHAEYMQPEFTRHFSTDSDPAGAVPVLVEPRREDRDT